jgi:uncharacterized membrane protein YeaQ/YmgE (transglycosylase-associated protein family)
MVTFELGSCRSRVEEADISVALFGFIAFGALVGAVVRMLAAGRAGGWTGSTLSGAAGALIGGAIGRVEVLRDRHDSGGFSLALVGAFIVVGVYAFPAARRARTVALRVRP